MKAEQGVHFHDDKWVGARDVAMGELESFQITSVRECIQNRIA